MATPKTAKNRKRGKTLKNAKSLKKIRPLTPLKLDPIPGESLDSTPPNPIHSY